MGLKRIGRRIYRDLSGEDGTKSREKEFATLFRGSVIGYGLAMVFAFFVLIMSRVIGPNVSINIMGTVFIIMGTILFGLGTLTILPEFKNLYDIKRQISAYSGVALVSTGSVFLIAPDLIKTGFENSSSSISLYFSSLLFVFLFAFVATIFIFYLFFDYLKTDSSESS